MSAQFRFLHGESIHIGLVRERQEDCLFASSDLLAVADGLGGHAGGRIASEMAVTHLSDAGGFETLDALAERVQSAHRAICARSLTSRGLGGMATTLCALAVLQADDDWALGGVNVGDSRLYALTQHPKRLTQITTDHNEAGELRAAGLIDGREARHSVLQRHVTRCLGYGDSAVRVDCFGINPSPGSKFMVCTDGLTGEVGDARIKAALQDAQSPQQAADSLVDMALGRHGRDNIAVVVGDLAGGEPGERMVVHPRTVGETEGQAFSLLPSGF